MLTTEQINLPVNARNMYQVINKPRWNRLFILGLKIWILYFFPEYFCPAFHTDDSATMLQVSAEVSEMPQCCFASVNSTLVTAFVLITILRPSQLQEMSTCWSQGALHVWRNQDTEDHTEGQCQCCPRMKLAKLPGCVPGTLSTAQIPRGAHPVLPLTAIMACSKFSTCDSSPCFGGSVSKL